MTISSSDIEQAHELFDKSVLILIDDLIDECNLALEDFERLDSRIERDVKIKVIPAKEKEILIEMNKVLITGQFKQKFVDKLSELNKLRFQYEPKKRVRAKGKITEDMVARVKQIPITEEVSFDYGKATSVWSPHEKTPSMHYYPEDNRVWCFASGEGGDIIDFIKQRDSLDFKQAVTYLMEKYGIQ